MNEIDDRILRLIEVLLFQKVIDSDTQFAEAIGLGRQTISNIKGRNQHFTVAHILRICKVYNANPKYIFGFENAAFNYKASAVIDFDKITAKNNEN